MDEIIVFYQLVKKEGNGFLDVTEKSFLSISPLSTIAHLLVAIHLNYNVLPNEIKPQQLSIFKSQEDMRQNQRLDISDHLCDLNIEEETILYVLVPTSTMVIDSATPENNIQGKCKYSN